MRRHSLDMLYCEMKISGFFFILTKWMITTRTNRKMFESVAGKRDLIEVEVEVEVEVEEEEEENKDEEGIVNEFNN